ncbi:MAG TPA: ribonuclease H-like domain-containing protein [Roseiflexaceae bacterium]|nr:ribonuclease H-like domain-containing protein [Roseiflexaceae bacterium]
MTNTLHDPTEHCAAVGEEWVTPSKLRPLFFDDPASIWLEHHGAAHGLVPDEPEYSMLEFRAEKGRLFETVWLARVAPEAVQVCREPWEGREPQRVRESLELMRRGVPVIAQPALWWPQERIYGVPDLLVRCSWLAERFPQLPDLHDQPDHYMALDLKFSRGLDQSDRRPSRDCYEGQVRLYSYMLGHIQGLMPRCAWLVTRDQPLQPRPVRLRSTLGAPLDSDLARLRDRYQEIRFRGADLLPWRDETVAPNEDHDDERWVSARAAIAARVPGGDLRRLWQVGRAAKRLLRGAGIHNLDALLAAEFDQLPASALRRPEQMRAILQANRSGQAVLRPEAAPPAQRHELFVDFEIFSNFNVDIEREWPDLQGTPMIFLIGVGWTERGQWRYQQLAAAAEHHAAERQLLDAFGALLRELTGGNLRDCALYHWHNAEPRYLRVAADRHHLSPAHPLRGLPWRDLEQICIDNACAVPGAWGYSLKAFANALSAYAPDYDARWPRGISNGGVAQLVGWHAYRQPDPLRSREMQILAAYLEADCRAVWQILRWLREAA